MPFERRAVIAGQVGDDVRGRLGDLVVVAEVDDVRAALAALIAHGPALLVIGAGLRGGDAAELATLAERNHPHTRVVLAE